MLADMFKKYQLRRIGLPPTIEEAKNIYSINEDTTFIGRGKNVDIFLDSSIRKGLISRAHAYISRCSENDKIEHKIFDTSINGTYVNEIRVQNFTILKEGDKVAFGHLRGAIIQPGEEAPQKETEFLFKFETTIKNEIDKKPTTEPLKSYLPGLHQAFNYEKQKYKETKVENKLLTDLNDIENGDLKSVISSVTSNILKEESSENDFCVEIKPEIPLECASTISSDVDIKRDTSLSLTHVYENVRTPDVFNEMKSKIKMVLDGDKEEENKKNLIDLCSDDDSSVKTEDIIHPFDDQESLFSDKSSEISDSDSDYIPPENVKPLKKSSRSRRVATRFTPEQSPKKVKLSVEPKPHQMKSNANVRINSKQKPIDSRIKMRRVINQSTSESSNNPKKDGRQNSCDTRKNKNVNTKFTHDRCAAWDCVIPPGSLKQITWIACDDCDAWYHLTCSGISLDLAKKRNTKFHCGCS